MNKQREGLDGRTHSTQCWQWHLDCAQSRIAELKSAIADACNRGAMTDPPGDYALVPLDAMERLEALKRGDE